MIEIHQIPMYITWMEFTNTVNIPCWVEFACDDLHANLYFQTYGKFISLEST